MSLSDEINGISDRVFELEQENEKLKQQLQAKSQELDNKNEFIRLMQPYMANCEANFDVLTDKYQELVRAYRKANRKVAVDID